MLRLFSRFMPKPGPRKDPHTHPDILQARQLVQSGQMDMAEWVCNQILTAEPENAEAYNVLGGIALQQSKHELAIAHFSKALKIDSNQPVFHQGLGIAHCNLGQLPEALRSFLKAVALAPKDPAAHNNLGNCYKQGGSLTDAKRCYRKAISVSPTYLTGYLNLGDLLAKQRKHETAVKTYRKALSVASDIPENQVNLVLLHYHLGLALRQLDETDDAITHYREVLARQPDFALAHNSLGGALLIRNELSAAMESFKQALALQPSYYWVHSNVLLTMNYSATSTQDQIYEESLRFDEQHARRLLHGPVSFQNSRDERKILRIGYLSSDFREHSVAHFTRKLLGEHDREAVEVFCYGHVETPDDFTRQFQARADQWLSISEMKDEDVVEHIRRDGIDILVDLGGHTADNRLLVFARRPAPIQVTWLGYPNTTGMRVMDYRLTDSVADPPGEADQLHTEKLVRLKHGFLCYQTDESIPAVAEPPSIEAGNVTFGSFNALRKVTPEVIRVWSEILQSVPGARLVMKSDALKNESTKSRLLEMFRMRGIAADRLDLLAAFRRRKDHMALYSSVDIGLDPFPYNGATTTCEALWMGVPVICLRGNRHAGRVGASIMHHAGLPQLVAENEDEYVDLARQFASEPERLDTLRHGLTAKVRRSAVMDVPLFTKTLEDAYREMWITWCNR